MFIRGEAMVRAASAAAGLLLVASGCGNSGQDNGASDSRNPSPVASSTPSATPSAETSTETACDKIWVVGHWLPKDYKGCKQGAKFVRKQGTGCSSGQELVVFDKHFYAVRGGLIRGMKNFQDKRYQESLATCTA